MGLRYIPLTPSPSDNRGDQLSPLYLRHTGVRRYAFRTCVLNPRLSLYRHRTSLLVQGVITQSLGTDLLFINTFEASGSFAVSPSAKRSGNIWYHTIPSAQRGNFSWGKNKPLNNKDITKERKINFFIRRVLFSFWQEIHQLNEVCSQVQFAL